MKNQNGLKALLLLSLLAMLSACAKSSTDTSGDFSSSAPATSSSASIYVSCSQATGYNSQMKINIRSFVTGSTVSPDFMRLKFSTLNSSYMTNSGYIQMYRWQSTNSSGTYLDPIPLSFRAEALSSGAVLTNYSSSLKWSDLSAAATSVSSSTIADLITKVRFTVNVRDASAEYQVLKVVYYDANGNIIDQTDMLMPLFAAHPTNYALQPDGAARPSILQNLHPFRSLAAQGYTANQILTYSNNFCF